MTSSLLLLDDCNRVCIGLRKLLVIMIPQFSFPSFSHSLGIFSTGSLVQKLQDMRDKLNPNQNIDELEPEDAASSSGYMPVETF